MSGGEERPEKVDPSLMLPICDQLFCCLPKYIRKYFWCGVDFDSIRDDEYEKVKVCFLKIILLACLGYIDTLPFSKYKIFT